MRTLLVISSAALFAAWGLGAQAPAAAQKKTSVSKTAPSKPAAAKSSAKTTTSVKSPPKTVATAHAGTAKPAPKIAYRRSPAVSKSGSKPVSKTATVAARRAAPPPPYRQQAPTPQRYMEIQQALVDKGYFSGPVDGNWGPGSVDALKRFQHDENITEDGKIGSLSLIALGLGPKRATPAEAASEKLGQR